MAFASFTSSTVRGRPASIAARRRQPSSDEELQPSLCHALALGGAKASIVGAPRPPRPAFGRPRLSPHIRQKQSRQRRECSSANWRARARWTYRGAFPTVRRGSMDGSVTLWLEQKRGRSPARNSEHRASVSVRTSGGASPSRLCAEERRVDKSTSASGAPDNSSLSHFSAMTRPSWLGRAVRNRHRHAIEQASRRWRGGRRDDSARTREILHPVRLRAASALMFRRAAARSSSSPRKIGRVRRGRHDGRQSRGDGGTNARLRQWPRARPARCREARRRARGASGSFARDIRRGSTARRRERESRTCEHTPRKYGPRTLRSAVA